MLEIISRQKLDAEYPHQVALHRADCGPDRSSLYRAYCANSNLGSGHRAIMINADPFTIFAFENAIDAKRFYWQFGGRQLTSRELALAG